jgi:hypothetical protein
MQKIGFNLNSGITKLSTTHSFKGYESPLIILFFCDKDSAEIIYTGLLERRKVLSCFCQAEVFIVIFSEEL